MIEVKGHPTPTPAFERSPLREHLFRSMAELLGSDRIRSADIGKELGWKLKNIMVATDFSACSTEAVSRAASLARHHDAKLTILHVIDVNPPTASTYCGPAESLMKELWVTGNWELCRLTESLAKEQTKTQTLMVEGLPAEAIIDKSSGFDLLVIGERRAKPSWNFFSRHTARQVVESAQCPVLVVRQ
jgi:nucleotide-binding universal stress UspA family protein